MAKASSSVLALSRRLWCYCFKTKEDKMSDLLNHAFLRLPKESKRLVVTTNWEGMSLIDLAIDNGLLNVLKYFCEHCDINLGKSQDILRYPLHDAAESGHPQIVKYLISLGCDVNLRKSSNGRTPLFLAKNNLEITKILIQQGADVDVADVKGLTPLMMAVGNESVCKFLLDSQAKINEENKDRVSALYLAVSCSNFRVVKLLVDRGASVVNSKGDIVLKRVPYICPRIMQFVTKKLSVEGQIEAYEIYGIQLAEDFQSEAIKYWASALKLREKHKIPKPPTIPKEVFKHIKEFSSIAELNTLQDSDSILYQCLIMSERIFGECDKITVKKVWRAGYFSISNFTEKFNLMSYAYEKYVKVKSVLDWESLERFQSICELLTYDFQRKIHLEQIHNILLVAMKGLSNPGCKYADEFNSFEVRYPKLLSKLVLMMYFYVSLCDNDEKEAKAVAVFRCYMEMLSLYPTTILHEAVQSLGWFCRAYIAIKKTIRIKLVKMLLESGANPNIRNEFKETPLLIAVKDLSYCHETIQLLIDFGAHVDIPDVNGVKAIDIEINTSKNINLWDRMSLKCLCATAASKLDYAGKLPKLLETFVRLHS